MITPAPGWHGELFAASCAEVYGGKFLKSEFYSVLNPVSFPTGQNVWFGRARNPGRSGPAAEAWRAFGGLGWTVQLLVGPSYLLIV